MHSAAAFAVLLLAGGCGGGGDTGGGTPEPTYEELVAQAWDAFEAADYAQAATGFGEALALDPGGVEAHSGRGWCRMILGDHAGSDADFGEASAGAAADAVRADLFAGWAFLANVYSPADDFAASNERVGQALALDPAWSFTHRSDLDHDDLYVLRAMNHYALGEFAESLVEVRRVEPAFDVDVDTPAGQAALAVKIEEISFGTIPLASRARDVHA